MSEGKQNKFRREIIEREKRVWKDYNGVYLKI